MSKYPLGPDRVVVVKKKSGGAGPYRKGAAFERQCQKYLEDKGFLVVRQPKSQSPFDLLATRRTFRILVQCKTGGKLPKKEREALLDLCELHHYSPILAQKDGKDIVLTFIDTKEVFIP